MSIYATLRSFCLRHAKPIVWLLSALELLGIVYIAAKFTFLKGLLVMSLFLICMVALGCFVGACDAKHLASLKSQFTKGYKATA